MKTIFMFSGQGSQYYQMGKKLFDTNTAFKTHMQQLDDIVQSLQGVSVLQELYNPKNRLSDPFISLKLTHPAIFMTEYSLAKVLEDMGIAPDYLLGCSLGEFTAATIAGILTETEALQLIVSQANMIENSCMPGRLVAILQDPAAYDLNPEINNNCSLAAIYSPSQFLIAGADRSLDRVVHFMKEKDFLHQELTVSYGFHSPAIDPAETAYISLLKNQAFRSPAKPLISGVTGSRLDAIPMDYFWQVVRKPIRFIDAVKTIENSEKPGEDLMFLDLGPAGSLANLIKHNTRDGMHSLGFQIMSPFQQEFKKLEEAKKYHQEHKKAPATKPPLKKERLLACIFPGQGSQKRGMGENLFDAFPKLTDRASEILGYPVKELCLQDPARQLNMTAYTQPALYIVNALSFLQLQETTGITPDFVAGHSLGEYNALFAAGGLDFETGLQLVQKRGALMSKMQEGGMAAVKGLTREEINHVIQRHGLEDIDIANYNTQNQIVLSGPKDLIARSGPHFEAAGATLYFVLNVSGAFHSRYMQPACEEFRLFLQPFNFSPLKIPVVSNVEAAFYQDATIKSLLADQLVKPVRWVESMQFLLEKGDLSFQEVGPGDVLTKMTWAIQRDLKEVLQ